VRHAIIYMFMSLVATLACGFSLVFGAGPLEALPEAVAAIGYAAMAAGHGTSRATRPAKKPARARRRHRTRRRRD
jgi:hypothetical protein